MSASMTNPRERVHLAVNTQSAASCPMSVLRNPGRVEEVVRNYIPSMIAQKLDKNIMCAANFADSALTGFQKKENYALLLVFYLRMVYIS